MIKKNIRQSITRAAATLLVAAACVSCGSQKQSGSSDTANTYNPSTPSASADLSSDFAALTSTYTAWKDVKMPVSLNMVSPGGIKVSGTATMVRNHGVHISLRMLGFEVAAMQIRGDSIFATYKIKKVYVAESISQLLDGFPVTTGNLQNLLLGQVFAPGEDNLTAASSKKFGYRSAADADLPGAFILTPTAPLRGVEAAFVVNGGTVPSLLALSVKAGENNATCVYADSQTSPAGRVAEECTVEGRFGKRNVKAELTWDLKKARWNTGEKLPALNTKGYSRINASQLLSSLTSL